MSLERPTFPVVRLREGYDIGEVDLAVAKALENLALPQPRIDRGDIEALRFAPVRLRPGYEMSPVDDWFDQVAAELAPCSGAQPVEATVPQPAPAAPAAQVDPAGGDRLQAALIIVVVLAVSVWIYVSRF